jgi:hypothetical protein
LSTADLLLENLTRGQTIPSANIAMSYAPQSNTVTFTFSGYQYGALPDGDYRAALPAGSVTDPAGNPLAAHSFEFFFLNGDANHDARVNLDDFNILAANFGQSPRDFTQGDFDYSGNVNLNDFNILASRFGSSLSVAPSTGGGGSGEKRGAPDESLEELLA